MDTDRVWNRVQKCVGAAVPKALNTAFWLLKIMIPVTFFVLVLDYTGWLAVMAKFVSPLFVWMGLPGESALVLLTSIFANIYSAIAVMTTIGFSIREATILAIMCLISHNFILESAVVRKTGSKVVPIVLVRLGVGLLAGVMLNALLPDWTGQLGCANQVVQESFVEAAGAWAIQTLFLILKIVGLITALMVLQQLLQEFGIIRALKRPLDPVIQWMGLSRSTTFAWIVANVLGLAYGAAILIEEVEQGKMTRDEADLLNHHLVVSHSNLEDPLLFAAIGLPLWWLIWPRVLLAVVVVYLRRLWLKWV